MNKRKWCKIFFCLTLFLSYRSRMCYSRWNSTRRMSPIRSRKFCLWFMDIWTNAWTLPIIANSGFNRIISLRYCVILENWAHVNRSLVNKRGKVIQMWDVCSSDCTYVRSAVWNSFGISQSHHFIVFMNWFNGSNIQR